MKKGCFFTVIILLTFAIGAGVYVFKYHRSKVVGVFKPLVVRQLNKEFDSKIDKIKDSPYVDTLKSLVKAYAARIENTENLNLDDPQDFIDELQRVLHRQKIDSSDIDELTILLNKERIANERPKKNGN